MQLRTEAGTRTVPAPDHPELPTGALRCARRPLGTAETRLVFGYSSEIAAGEEGVASHAPLDWNQTWEWLRDVEELRRSLGDAPTTIAGSP